MIPALFNNLINSFPLHKQQIDIVTEFHGNEYGGWTINPKHINKDSVIYSFGVGEDITFDLSLIEKYNCQVFAFDPTPKSIMWIKTQVIPSSLKFEPIGISNKNETRRFYLPTNPNYVSHTVVKGALSEDYISVKMNDLGTIAKRLMHKKIDILKMDIEGSEYEVIPNILDLNLEIPQILVEFHHRFNGIGRQKTIKAVDLLNDHGYKIFNVSKHGQEYSFLKI